MKMDMSARKNHTVTVPRDYLESLEAFYQENMEKHYNMRGDIRTMVIRSDTKPHGVPIKTLFISDGSLQVQQIIVVDNDGHEQASFQRN